MTDELAMLIDEIMAEIAELCKVADDIEEIEHAIRLAGYYDGVVLA